MLTAVVEPGTFELRKAFASPYFVVTKICEWAHRAGVIISRVIPGRYVLGAVGFGQLVAQTSSEAVAGGAILTTREGNHGLSLWMEKSKLKREILEDTHSHEKSIVSRNARSGRHGIDDGPELVVAG